MRWVLGAAIMLALAPGAFAADLDILRGAQSVGPATFTRWSGFYFGGQFGASDTKADFQNSTVDPISYAFRGTALEESDNPGLLPVLGVATKGGAAFGGFVGYNTQWQDLVLGLEANYNHAMISVIPPSSSIARVIGPVSNGDTYYLNITGSGQMTDLDYGTLRLRAGWVVGDYLLPYGFAGVALGRTDLAVSATIFGEQNPPTPFVYPCPGGAPTCFTIDPFTVNGGRTNDLLYGFSVGGGLDVALTSNIFLRGEYEFVQFAQSQGILISVSSARVGAGLKF